MKNRSMSMVLAAAVSAIVALAFVPGGAATHGEGEPACPEDLDHTQLRNGIVLLNWSHAPDSDASNIYRTIDGGEEELLESIPSDEESFYADANTTHGADHTYEIRAVYGDHESTGCPTVTASIQEFPFPGPTPEGECPRHSTLDAMANQDGSVSLEAGVFDRELDLLRSVAGEDDFEHLTTLDPGNATYHDTETEPTVTYEYRTMVEDNICATAEVTAIPFFGSAALASVAALGAVGVYLVHRRRA